MQEFKGTPGKWSFYHNSSSDKKVACIEICSSESLHEVAYLQSTPPSIGKYEQTSFDKTIANAHLIASAPELLEALQGFYSWFNRIYGDDLDYHEEHPIAVAKSAIAKALGK
ncbi:TPA: hypothetical protein ACIJM1_003125 [Klebsiella aerogenes]